MDVKLTLDHAPTPGNKYLHNDPLGLGLSKERCYYPYATKQNSPSEGA